MPVGFVSGIEVCHPDKRVEMLLYELSVAETHRRRGIGRGLVEELLALAADIGCRGMWVPLDSDNEAAIATYRSARADETETSLIMSWDLEAPGGHR